MPVLCDLTLKCLSMFLKLAERVNIDIKVAGRVGMAYLKK